MRDTAAGTVNTTPDVVGALQLLGEGGQVYRAAEALVLVDEEGDPRPEGPQFAGETDGLFQFSTLAARVEIFSDKMRVTLAFSTESS